MEEDMIMKQFSIKEYLANPSRGIVTRDGRSVRIHCTNYVNAYPVIAEIEGSGELRAYTKDGALLFDEDSSDDLFFASQKHKGWVNIYAGPVTGVVIYKTEENAKCCANKEVIATIMIEWEE